MPAAILHGPSALLRARRLRPRWRRLVLLLLLFDLLERIQNATRGRRCDRRRSARRLRLRDRRAADDRSWPAIIARVPRQKQAGDEEANREHGSGARQEIGSAAAR